MALEEFCAKQTSEIMQLNRLVNFFLFYLQPSHCFLCTLLLMNISLVFVGATVQAREGMQCYNCSDKGR